MVEGAKNQRSAELAFIDQIGGLLISARAQLTGRDELVHPFAAQTVIWRQAQTLRKYFAWAIFRSPGEFTA